MSKILTSSILVLIILLTSFAGFEVSASNMQTVSMNSIETENIDVNLNNCYECKYKDDGINITLSDGTKAVIANLSETAMYVKGDTSDTISYKADTEFYVNDDFTIEMIESKKDTHDLLDENGDAVGYTSFNRDSNIVTIKDINENVIALCNYGGTCSGYDVVIYENDICSDTTILMIASTYVVYDY